MDMHRLDLLRELRLRGSVTAVAQATHRTPSAVSQQLKTLEREAGVPLTERVGRGIALTDAGEALAHAAGEIAVAIAHADELWRGYLERPEGRVGVAVFPTAGRMFLPDLLAEARRTRGLTIVASDGDPGPAGFAALTHDTDVVVAHAVGPEPTWQDRDLVVMPLCAEPLDVALPVGHPLADRAAVSAADVAALPWIGVPDGYPYDRVLREIERVAGAALGVRQRFSDTRITESLVAAGEGAALLPRFTSRDAPGIRLVPLATLAPVRTLAALTRVETAERPSVQVVLAALTRIAGGLG